MALFEQRISDDEVAAARKKIAAGASLRSAAAKIPCAPSTLSLRIKKAAEAEADARDPARRRAAEDARGGAVRGEVGPVETLRGALHATKASGLPDWPTRVSAARALAALRPQELEPKPETQPPATPTIIVYDLPPGANPVLHHPQSTRTDPPAGDTEAPADPPADPPPPPNPYWFSYQPADGEMVVVGQWSPASPDPSSDQPAADTMTLCVTHDPETADFWRAELSAGRLPASSEDEP